HAPDLEGALGDADHGGGADRVGGHRPAGRVDGGAGAVAADEGVDVGRPGLGAAQPQRWIGHDLGAGERCVDLDDVDLLGRVGDAGLPVGDVDRLPEGDEVDQRALGPVEA